jgi:MFS family permease
MTCGIANSTGLVIGALFVEFTSWQWVLWFVCILALPITGLCTWLVPQQDPTRGRVQSSREKLRRLDIPGVTVLTSGLVLFIFSITSGSEEGWGSAMVLAPLIISLALIAGFFWYETRTPEEYAAM